MALKDIIPILQNLTHLLSQDERKIDRYDAQAFVDLEHTPGYGLANARKNLKLLAKHLKQVISLICPRHKAFTVN